MSSDERCPKCDAPRSGSLPACPRCGLATSHAAAWKAADAEAPTASLGAAWAACEAGWDDEARHEAAATAAFATSDYGWLAKRYREVLRTRPDDPVASARLDVLTRRAQAALMATATPKPERATRRFPMVALIVVVAAIAGTALYAAHLGRDRATSTGVRRPVEPNRPGPRTLPEPAIEPAAPRR
ncbi:MAG: hypothetical protein JNK64_10570 [Myxococcales bacterium]|nr:hypothetical protein [Myxococcales bacterium]